MKNMSDIDFLVALGITEPQQHEQIIVQLEQFAHMIITNINNL